MFKLDDKLTFKGTFEMNVFKKGKLIENYKNHNLIVDIGLNQISKLLAGDVVGRSITKIAFGTDGTLPVPNDTFITDVFSKDLVNFEFPDLSKIQFNWELLDSENNGMAIREFGLLTQDGLLFARIIRESAINKEDDISIFGKWTIEFAREEA